MTEQGKTVFSRVVASVTGGGLVSLLRTRTIVVLVLLLLALVAGIELARPGTVNALWVSNCSRRHLASSLPGRRLSC